MNSYHSFALFGLTNKQVSIKHQKAQETKAPILTAYIAYAIAKGGKSFTELFCADGYYSVLAAKLGCHPVTGIDNNRDGYLTKAPKIAKELGVDIEFKESDISPDSEFEQSDIVLNAGGLYHVSDPERVLFMSYRMAKKFLIVQTVVSLETEAPDYFVRPAPGWSWGNRYSRQSFEKMVDRYQFTVVDSHFNELEGNGKPKDRGSAYYLIKKDGD